MVVQAGNTAPEQQKPHATIPVSKADSPKPFPVSSGPAPLELFRSKGVSGSTKQSTRHGRWTL